MLESYTVLDFTDERGELGPMVLGDLGADVIRVEPPDGSRARQSQPTALSSEGATHSLSFAAFNRNKRSIVLHPDDPADQAVLRQLVSKADFVFESHPAGLLSEYGLDHAALCDLNPQIVHVRLSPFGGDGPHAELIGNDLTIAAMGGPVALQGCRERAPVRLSVPQVWRHAGVEAAAGALAAHARMRRCGGAQQVDVSAQCVMTWTLLNAMDAFAIQGFEFERVGSAIDNGVLRVELVHATADGHLVALPNSKTIEGCMDWMIADGIIDDSYRQIDWQAYDLNLMNPDYEPVNMAQGLAICRRFFALHTKQELFEFGLQAGVTLAPVNTLDELLAMEHMQTRGYWQPLSAAQPQVKAPGMWAKSPTLELPIRRSAPGLGEHSAEIRMELGSSASTSADRSPASEQDAQLPFAGVRVADFSWVGVGPISAKYLADHGADVIRVESENRPDVLRAGGPYKGGEPGWNRSQFFADFNTSKRSLTLDLKRPDAIELAKKLIRESDVLIESFSPGAITRMGMGYEEIRAINPGIIMVSTCLMGQTGPARNLAGFGYHAGAIAGFYEVTGWPDREPNGPWVAYTDTVAPRFISVLLAAALDHKRRTGEGAYFDVAQIETALHFLAPELLNAQVNGVTASRMGNRSAYCAPQGCYPCAGDDDAWCAIAVETDAQWQALCTHLGEAPASAATHAERLACHDALDAKIAAWTRTLTPQQVMATLQASGVPAGVVQRSKDLLEDPQYLHRNFYRYHTHTEMGEVPYAGHQFRIAGYDSGPRFAAPMLGEHSFEILSDTLGLTDEDVATAYASGAIV